MNIDLRLHGIEIVAECALHEVVMCIVILGDRAQGLLVNEEAQTNSVGQIAPGFEQQIVSRQLISKTMKLHLTVDLIDRRATLNDFLQPSESRI